MMQIRSELVEAIDAAGVKVQFVVLDDSRCAVIRSGAFVFVGTGDDEGVQQGLTVFNTLAKSRMVMQPEPVLRAG
jgi:hypothetical protein